MWRAIEHKIANYSRNGMAIPSGVSRHLLECALQEGRIMMARDAGMIDTDPEGLARQLSLSKLRTAI